MSALINKMIKTRLLRLGVGRLAGATASVHVSRSSASSELYFYRVPQYDSLDGAAMMLVQYYEHNGQCLVDQQYYFRLNSVTANVFLHSENNYGVVEVNGAPYQKSLPPDMTKKALDWLQALCEECHGSKWCSTDFWADLATFNMKRIA